MPATRRPLGNVVNFEEERSIREVDAMLNIGSDEQRQKLLAYLDRGIPPPSDRMVVLRALASLDPPAVTGVLTEFLAGLSPRAAARLLTALSVTLAEKLSDMEQKQPTPNPFTGVAGLVAGFALWHKAETINDRLEELAARLDQHALAGVTPG